MHEIKLFEDNEIHNLINESPVVAAIEEIFKHNFIG